jgi:hypothetical protein
MEITIGRSTIYGSLVCLALLSLLGLGALGKPYTPVTSAGDARLLTWDDWQLLKAERQYDTEREVLRSDADALTALLNQNPDPVAAQLLAQRIKQHTASGQAALQPARTALLQAAQDVASWTAGALDRNTAVASLQTATDLLK